MSLHIKKPTDAIKINSVKILIYGQPGVRKTSYAFTSPKPLLIDFDGGIRRVRPEHRGDYIEVSKWEDVQNITREDLEGYDSIILDTVGKALDFLTEYLIRKDAKIGRNGNLTLQGYGVLKSNWSQFLAKVSTWGKHIVLVAHDKEGKNGDDTIIRPDITGSSLGAVIRDMDLVGYMQSFNNQSTVSFTPSDAYYGKNTCGFPDKSDLKNLPLTTAFMEYESKVNEGNKDADLYKEQMAKIEAMLSEIDGCEGLNNLLEGLKNTSFVLDGKAMAAQMVKAKAVELNCKLNPITKKYTANEAL